MKSESESEVVSDFLWALVNIISQDRFTDITDISY